jgi:parallel beta-helix repeat protein
MNRVVFGSLTILCLFSVLSITGLIQVVKAARAVYIRVDGAIDPMTAPMYTADNITYTLTGNITADADGIVIERDNIVLNGAGYTVAGSGIGNGTTLTNRSNVTVRNMTITFFYVGIGLGSSSSNVLFGNNVTADNWVGIEVESSSNNTLSGNNAVGNYDGIYLESSSNNTLSGNNAANNWIGFELRSSSDNTLSGNNAANGDYGIYLFSSNNNFIFHNNLVNNPVYTAGSVNIWDDGSRGNYWSDYLTKHPFASEVDGSGVWNAPYVIGTNNTDHYPLMVQNVIPEFPSFLILSLMMVATLLVVIICKKKGVKRRNLRA